MVVASSLPIPPMPGSSSSGPLAGAAAAASVEGAATGAGTQPGATGDSSVCVVCLADKVRCSCPRQQQDHSAAMARGVAASSGVNASTRRLLCPVPWCPHSVLSSSTSYRGIGHMRNHLNDHATGMLSGAIPAAFLHAHSYSQCSECNKILHSRFRGTCHRCRPNRRARDTMENLRPRPAFQAGFLGPPSCFRSARLRYWRFFS